MPPAPRTCHQSVGLEIKLKNVIQGYCSFNQPTDKHCKDLKGPRNLTDTVRHREISKQPLGLEPMSSQRGTPSHQNNFTKLP